MSEATPINTTGAEGIPSRRSVEGASPSSASRNSLVKLRGEISKAVVGQDAVVSGIAVALIAGGHVLLEGVPGTAKTLLVRTLGHALDLEMKRVQFTPDLMPADITGSLVYDSKVADFKFRPGPIFTNLLLADEINRTPPKTQSALLEAMEEQQVTVDAVTRKLPSPFMVLATQNPIEQEGTYPLPEAQLDRFLFHLNFELPSRDEEIDVLSRHAHGFNPRDLNSVGVQTVTTAEELLQARLEAANLEVNQAVLTYIVDLVRATRSHPAISRGVSPRGATALLAAARAWAWLSGRSYVIPDDVKILALPAMRHRIALKPEAQLEGLTAPQLLNNILAAVPVPR
ncbi:AAA family ATPase [Boudabousia marimammalium]|uniref:AAA family ATPase n=1 Tax=Boudabousia marimammalium TaxID=156892 RepID=A0A1Q5PRY6_9ACTO|nr:MoxR family ATPase [Boudabousia marimammalium]OKL50205.1 AAA family ATPase [Boudabousia marimammalium]